jgi:6-pyruvoyl-tetrahydropterin synthase
LKTNKKREISPKNIRYFVGEVLSLIYQAVKMRNDFKNLIELLDYFKEEKTCQEFLAHQIWDEGKAVCPHCNA